MTRHLTRQQLLKARKTRSEEAQHHLDTCIECSEQFNMLMEYLPNQQTLIHNVPEYLVERARGIVKSGSLMSRAYNLLAKLTFDSWQVAAENVRSLSTSQERRVHFLLEPEQIAMEIRFEQHDNKWNLIASITGAGEGTRPVLLINRRELQASNAGFYLWTGTRPPRNLAIKIGDNIIELPEIQWK